MHRSRSSRAPVSARHRVTKHAFQSDRGLGGRRAKSRSRITTASRIRDMHSGTGHIFPRDRWTGRQHLESRVEHMPGLPEPAPRERWKGFSTEKVAFFTLRNSAA